MTNCIIVQTFDQNKIDFFHFIHLPEIGSVNKVKTYANNGGLGLPLFYPNIHIQRYCFITSGLLSK